MTHKCRYVCTLTAVKDAIVNEVVEAPLSNCSFSPFRNNAEVELMGHTTLNFEFWRTLHTVSIIDIPI